MKERLGGVMEEKKEIQSVKKKKESMSMWAVILTVILVVYVLSFIIPSGAYQRVGKNVIPGTFAITNKVYMNPLQVILGIGDSAFSSFGGLFIAIIVVGGMMGVVNSTGVIDAALHNLIRRLKDKAFLIIPAFIFAMGFLGSLGSMISSVVLFIPLGLSIAKQMKTNKTFAVGLIIMGSYTGFMSSPVNTLTTVLGQGIAGLEPYSGAGLRTVVTITNLVLVSLYLIWYAKRAAKTDKWKTDFSENGLPAADTEAVTRALTKKDVLIICIFFGAFAFFAVGAPLFHFTTLNLGSIMLPVGLVCGLIAGYDLNKTMTEFVNGAKSMSSVIVFMILASTMAVILNGTMILDSIVYYLSIPLNYMGSTMAAIGMFVVNAIVNIFINSGSGQTAVMMPIMAPLADVVGVSRQMAVMTLQFGDGFTNLLAPTSVNLLACLALARISLKDWYKLAVPIHIIEFVVMCGFIVIGTMIGF